MMPNTPWGEHEIDYVLILRNFDLSRIKVNPEEVEDYAGKSYQIGVDSVTKCGNNFRWSIDNYASIVVVQMNKAKAVMNKELCENLNKLSMLSWFMTLFILVVSLDELKKRLENPNANFTPWFQLFANLGHLETWWKNIEQLEEDNNCASIIRM